MIIESITHFQGRFCKRANLPFYGMLYSLVLHNTTLSGVQCYAWNKGDIIYRSLVNISFIQ
jgi:hypothetical protein